VVIGTGRNKKRVPGPTAAHFKSQVASAEETYLVEKVLRRGVNPGLAKGAIG